MSEEKVEKPCRILVVGEIEKQLEVERLLAALDEAGIDAEVASDLERQISREEHLLRIGRYTDDVHPTSVLDKNQKQRRRGQRKYTESFSRMIPKRGKGR